MARIILPSPDIPLVDPKTGLVNIDWYDKLQQAVQAKPKIVNFQRVLSLAGGQQSVTGVGFTPSLINFTVAAVTSAWGSIGQADGTINSCMEFASSVVNFQAVAGILRDSGVNYQSFTLTSFDPDGFTIGWAKTGTPTATAFISATCFR